MAGGEGRSTRAPLPIDAVLGRVAGALDRHGVAVLEAPPGAGKTTRVPMALLEAGANGRIVMLEPRRIAARAAAERMAEELGERVGQTVGYRIRGEAKVSGATRIEVVTDGILTRMLQGAPDLPGIGTVIFDEFHERSLNADLGLAFCLEARAALRADLRVLVMSATLDGAAVADLVGGPLIRSDGQVFPVETRWLDRPLLKDQRLEAGVAVLVERAVAETETGVLAFLPGEGEIRRVEAALAGRLSTYCTVRPLFGALPFDQQRAAIAPEPGGRKVVLATAIAETSLTIEGIGAVVDAGLARRARFDPGSGMARLVTERVSRAEAAQRRGRAGRLSEGICYRLWSKAEEGGLPAHPPAEIEVADLAGLALDLAAWGTRDPGDLAFLTPPPEGPLAAARALLRALGALTDDGAIADHGREMARLPLHPRLAHMLIVAGSEAAPLAAFLSEGGRRESPDITAALRGMSGRTRAEARRLAKRVPPRGGLSAAQMAALAYPDRVGLRRPCDEPRWLLSGGMGVRMAGDEPLAGARMIVVTDTDGAARDALVRQAAGISEAEIREVFADAIHWREICEWSRREGRVVARRQEFLGALILDDRVWRAAPEAAIAGAMLDGVRALGLVWTDAAARFRARVELVRKAGADLPEMTDEALVTGIGDWLLPHLGGVRTAEEWRRFDLLPALRAMLDWDRMQALDRAAPPAFVTALGRKVPLDYSGGAPEISVRLQEMFGVTEHPQVAGAPLRVTLLSPAGRPVQVTDDLPGFWTSSYADVRKEMRGRYPKHPWPEDPTVADPTLRAKRRG